MRKRFSILILAILLLVVAVSPALAHERPVQIAGEITVVDTATAQLTVRLRYGDPVTVQTSGETEFFRKVEDVGLEPILFDGLLVGDRVHIWGTRNDGVVQANMVIVMPESKMIPDNIQGTISVLDLDNEIITVTPTEEDPVIVLTTEETKFFRVVRHGRLQVIAFAELAVGDRVKAQGEWDGETFTAKHVTVMPLKPTAPPPDRVSGKITDLDAAGWSFTLEPQRKDAFTVQTAEAETRFYRAVRRGSMEVISFEELAVDDLVNVYGQWDGDQLNATIVLVKPERGGGPDVFTQVDQ